MWASLGFTLVLDSWSEFFTEKTGTREPFCPLFFCFHISPSLYTYSFLLLFLTHISFFILIEYFSSLLFSPCFSLIGLVCYCFLCDLKMRKMKGVASAAAPMEYSPYAMIKDQRNRFKHQSLLQDYEELQKETEAMGKRLHLMKERKLTLLAEVRFLKRRYNYLMQNKSPNPLMERNHMQQKNLGIRSKSIMKGKNNGRKQTASKLLVPAFEFNQKGKTLNEKEATLRCPPQFFHLNQMQQKTNSVKEVPFQNTMPVLDLNENERVYSAKEATARTITPIFDLNQISVEVEEFQANEDSLKVEEPKKSYIRSGSEEQHNDVKLSACRSTGNVPNRVGKRKITWQDQVALRV